MEITNVISNYNNAIDDLEMKVFCLDDVGKIVSIQCKGHITKNNYNEYIKNVIATAEAGYINQIWDVRDIVTMTNAIGEYLGTILKKIILLNGDIVILNPNENVKNAMMECGFCQFINSLDNQIDAERHFNDRIGLKNEHEMPFVIACPICREKLQIKKSGVVSCQNCKTKISISQNGQVEIA